MVGPVRTQYLHFLCILMVGISATLFPGAGLLQKRSLGQISGGQGGNKTCDDPIIDYYSFLGKAELWIC